MFMKYLVVLLVLFPFGAGLFAQAAAPVVAQRPIAAQQWEKAAEGLDYSRDIPEAEKKKKETSERTNSAPANPWPDFNMQALGNMLQILAILLAIALIGYGVYRMMQEPRNKRIARDGALITVDNLETYLHETDLDRFLREALARQDFAQAVRIYFLQLIKQLSNSGAIHWSKEKTNRDYLREMRQHPQYDRFQRLTRSFERIWYGNIPLNAADFALLEPQFKEALQQSNRP